MSYNINLKTSEKNYLQDYALLFLKTILENSPDIDNELEVCVTYEADNNKMKELPNTFDLDLHTFNLLSDVKERNLTGIEALNFTFKRPVSPKWLLSSSEKLIEQLSEEDGFLKSLGFGLTSSRPELRPLIYCFQNRVEFKVGLEKVFISFAEEIINSDIRKVETTLVPFQEFMVGVAARIEFYH